MFPTPIPTGRYEVVGWKWTMTGYGREKGEVLEKQMKTVTSLKIVIKLFLPFSIKI